MTSRHVDQPPRPTSPSKNRIAQGVRSALGAIATVVLAVALLVLAGWGVAMLVSLTL